MSDHIHVWQKYGEAHFDGEPTKYPWASCTCGAVMSLDEMLRRVNAVERLSRDDAGFLSGIVMLFVGEHPEGYGMRDAVALGKFGERAAAYSVALDGEDPDAPIGG